MRAWRREIEALKLGEAVKVMGNLPHHDLPALYQHARINLFASCTENCPNILLEMMASGRPALVSERGPMPEFGGQSVSYFDPGNVGQLAARWVDLLSDPERGAHLAAQGYRASLHTSWGEGGWGHSARGATRSASSSRASEAWSEGLSAILVALASAISVSSSECAAKKSVTSWVRRLWLAS